jgi:hypothetical protein
MNIVDIAELYLAGRVILGVLKAAALESVGLGDSP